jgi:two-component system, sensor histidine kinase
MLRRLSVRIKLLVLMLFTTLVALAVAFAALIAYDLRTYHSHLLNDLSTQADILGRASVAAIAFDDPKSARETLALLGVRPQVLAAAIYDPQSRLFAAYSRAGKEAPRVPPRPGALGARVVGSEITLYQAIVEDGRGHGTVYIRARYEIVDRLLDYVSILALTLVLSMVVALLMSAWLQKMVTLPIIGISEVARNVMESRDFSFRAEKTTEDEVGYLVDAFNDMLAEIGRRSEALLLADRMKDQFLATLAHELRNPLAPISNALHLLEVAGDRPQVAAEARAMMARQLRQLVRLVDDLLDVSRITTGKLTLRREALELHEVIANAVEIARPLIESRRHELDVKLPHRAMPLHGDATRLAQVFSNLLNNAAKYTEPGGRIALSATVHDGCVEVTIVDNGIGIDPQMLPQVFEMFTQAETFLERGQGGLGVGLALARKLVEMHGGTIGASSEGAGRGSTFTVRLPLSGSAHTLAGDIDPAAPAVARAHRILVVDDNHDFAMSLAMILREMGHEVRVEHDGTAGLHTAETFRPTIAFLDIGMPGMSGYELARVLRSRCSRREVALVAVTGWGQDADKARAREAGFDQHLVKPLDPAAIPSLLDAVERELGPEPSS